MYKEVYLNTLLKQVKERLIINNTIDYKLVTISNTGEIKLREIVKGASIKNKTMYRLK